MSSPRRDGGVALLITLVMLVVLAVLSMTLVTYTITEAMMSNNVNTRQEAFFIAEAGAETAKDWLRSNIQNEAVMTALLATTDQATLSVGGATVTTPLGTQSFHTGVYQVEIRNNVDASPATPTVDRDGVFRITSRGNHPTGATASIEVYVGVPSPDIRGAVTIDGNGTHADFDDGSGGTGARIPSFSVDGRNHDLGGAASNACSGVSPFAGTTGNANTEITNEADSLKQKIVQRANAFCNANGSDGAGAGSCNPGLYWVRGSNSTTQFSNNQNDCPGLRCFKNLDLSRPELRATAWSGSPPAFTSPASPLDRGPFVPITENDPLMFQLNQAETRSQLSQLVTMVNASPAADHVTISGDLIGGTHNFGSVTSPKMVFVADGANDLEVKGGAVVNGFGVLVIPRRLRIRDATFNWTGVIIVQDDGDFRVGDDGGGSTAPTNGTINGALFLQDLAGNDPKFDVDKVGPGSSFSINYSCEGVRLALGKLLRTMSWKEQLR